MVKKALVKQVLISEDSNSIDAKAYLRLTCVSAWDKTTVAFQTQRFHAVVYLPCKQPALTSFFSPIVYPIVHSTYDCPNKNLRLWMHCFLQCLSTCINSDSLEIRTCSWWIEIDISSHCTDCVVYSVQLYRCSLSFEIK